MGLDAIYVHDENNDALATSFGAMHPGSFDGRGMRSSFGADALHLNETRPLLAAFEFCALTPREIHYAA